MRLLSLLVAGLLVSQLARGAETPSRHAELVLAGPGTTVSYPLFRMIESGALGPYADQVRFREWRNPDQMRALVISGQAHVSAVPTNVAAMLHNRGEPVQLLNVSVWGLLWLVSRDPQLSRLVQLRGQSVLIPFRNDMPDIVFRSLSTAAQLPADSSYRLHYAANGMNAVQLMLAGKADHVLLAEPAVSVLLLRNRARGGEPLYRAIDLTSLWAEHFPREPRMPQAGLMATRALQDEPELRRVLADAYAEASAWCQARIRECAELAHKYLPQIPVEGAVSALEHHPLRSRPAADVRADLEAFFTRIARQDPQKIGGRLPEPGFYGR